ncbi:MAG TPA: acetyl-CoA hydrolase/transferase C-terminal domain-containing protein [Rhodanobacteraceae bacterium]|nr:acetyl-CoA hydrolase/transferase C-terminal domain-containing protein [Rhodanobacteraceae bacterium]
MTNRLQDPLAAAVDLILARSGRHLALATPLGLGKPNRLINAIYRRIVSDPTRRLTIYTALSLDLPTPHGDLERRFLGPFLDRHFGADYPRLDYVADLRANRLPANVRIQEFYFQSGTMLDSERAQQDYTSINYTSVARDLVDAGIDAIVQLVARRGKGREARYSLSCNPDVTLDLLDAIVAAGKVRPLLVGVVHPDLPFLGGAAEVGAGLFDLVIDEARPPQPLFALPRDPIDNVEHAIGLHASALVRDGGTLQIGIGALSDALVNALLLRHHGNADYLAALASLRGDDPGRDALISRWGGLGGFASGLYGASEMIMDGFMHLRRGGVLKRVVGAEDEQGGHYLKGAFYLGSKPFYEWLGSLDGEDYRGLAMSRVSDVNQLYGGREVQDRTERREARFFNNCMMATALGAAVSDALADGRVVSGVGGQYNFVAMAQALADGRSILLLPSTHASGRRIESNVRWNYGHTTIPRHLRDIFITEYGIADLRGKSDADCVRAMLAITDARFQDALVADALRAGKLARDFRVEDAWRRNTPARIAAALKPFQERGLFRAFPFGSDFTAVEQRLLPALMWLKRAVADPRRWPQLLGALVAPGADEGDAEAGAGHVDAHAMPVTVGDCLGRLGLAATGQRRRIGERLLARLVRGAISRSR